MRICEGGIRGWMRWISRMIFGMTLLLFVAVSGMAVRSYFRGDYYGKCWQGRGTGISSVKGHISFDYYEMNPLFLRNGTSWGTTSPAVSPLFSPPKNFAERCGFWTIQLNTSAGLMYRCIFPYWF